MQNRLLKCWCGPAVLNPLPSNLACCPVCYSQTYSAGRAHLHEAQGWRHWQHMCKQRGKRACSLPLLLHLSHSAQLLPQPPQFSCIPLAACSWAWGVGTLHYESEVSGKERGTLQEMASHVSIHTSQVEARVLAYPVLALKGFHCNWMGVTTLFLLQKHMSK